MSDLDIDEPPCVCGCPSHLHFGWAGQCHGPCGCSYYLPDNGIEPEPGKVIRDDYNGIYARKWSVDA